MQFKFTFEDGSAGYLAHHGVKGMKWGVWNDETSAKYGGGDGSWKGAKKTTRQLNTLDKRKAVEIGKAYDAQKKADKTKSKLARAAERGASQEKVSKLATKMVDQRHEQYVHSQAAKGIEEHQQKLSRRLVEQGYNVQTKNVRRSTLTKGEKAAQILLNTAAAAAGSPVLYGYDRTVQGTKYKVRKPN